MTMTRCTDPNCDRTFTTVRGMRTHARTHGAAIKQAMTTLYSQEEAWVWNVSCITCRATVESPDHLERHVVHKHVVHWFRSRRGIDGATSTETWCATINFREASVDGEGVTCSACREALQEASAGQEESEEISEAPDAEDLPVPDADRFVADASAYQRVTRLGVLQVKTHRQHVEDAGAEVLRRIDVVTELIAEATRLQRDLVDQARVMDLSWSQIGGAVGVTRQAAQMRFAPKRPSGPEGAHPEQMTID